MNERALKKRLKEMRDEIGDYWEVYRTKIPIEICQVPDRDTRGSLSYELMNKSIFKKGEEGKKLIVMKIGKAVNKSLWMSKKKWRRKYAEKREDGLWYYKIR